MTLLIVAGASAHVANVGAESADSDIRVVLRMFDQNIADKIGKGFDIHLAMSEINDKGEGTQWFEKVSDGDYLKPPAPVA